MVGKEEEEVGKYSIEYIGHIKTIKLVIKINGQNIFLNALYRSPDGCPHKFNSDLLQYLSYTCPNENIYFFVGDINIDIKSNDNYCQEYLNNLTQLGFTSLINEYTRVQKNSKSCIDHIFLKGLQSEEIKAYVLKNDITDHFPVIAVLPIKNLEPSLPETKFEKLDMRKVRDCSKCENWQSFYEQKNIDQKADTFINKIKHAIKQSTKVIQFSNRIKKRHPWITVGIATSVQEKQKLYCRLLNDPNNFQLLEQYKQYRARVRKLINKAKIEYFSKQILSKKDSKEIWKAVNKFTNKHQNKTCIGEIEVDGKIINDKKELANKFNEHYATVGKKMAEKINTAQIPKLKTVNITLHSFFLHPVYLKARSSLI